MHDDGSNRNHGLWPHSATVMLAIVLSHLWAGLSIVLMLRRRRITGTDGPRKLFSILPNAYFCFALWQCMAGVVPIIILSILHSRDDFLIYVVNLGTYLMVSGERLFWIGMWTDPWPKSKMAGAMICDGVLLGLLVGCVPLAQQRVKWLVPALVMLLLQGAVWFALFIGPYDDFSMVVYLASVPGGIFGEKSCAVKALHLSMSFAVLIKLTQYPAEASKDAFSTGELERGRLLRISPWPSQFGYHHQSRLVDRSE
ncbi:hypothetical protein LA080_006040 [Diaporthe eres]|nr:hypothetical protein LA080_006040 [Diaporthe eres]